MMVDDKNNSTTRKYRVLSIDAWRDADGWVWSDWRKIGEVSEVPTSVRKVLKMLRAEGFLTEASKGAVCVEDDQYNIVVFDRSNGRPLIAIEYGNAD
jgi:hypothetical protein